jgi:two-component system chemotaxis response regulator CheB
MIVDDSSVYRRLLATVMEGMPELEVVGTAPNGPIALKKIPQLLPDVVLQDIEMPEMSGVKVLEAIKAESPHIAVVLLSGVNSRSADIVVEGLSKGAADFISKPDGGSLDENRARLKRDLAGVFLALRARIHPRPAAAAASVPVGAPARPSIAPGEITLVGIGVSTGGPQALGEVIPRLPEDFRVPVVIVQHMPPVFTASLARSLDRRAHLRVVEAEHDHRLEPGNVYVAPGGMHMAVSAKFGRVPADYRAVLIDSPPVNSCKPSVDVLFQSLASAAGRGALVVVMTGMGQDGLVGVEQVKRAGGYCITQSRETCTVYGMPQAVDQAALSDESLPLSTLAERIGSLVG